MTASRRRTYWTAAGVLGAAAAIAMASARGGRAATPPAPPPPEVSVIRVAAEPAASYRDYPARTYARDLVEVRGRVDGYVDRRSFAIGSEVRAGQELYVLDRRPYEAEVERARGAVAQAVADIAQAEAATLKARQDVERLEPLVEEEAAPRQDLDNARTARQASDALVTARRATLEANRAVLRAAELNLEYATIRAPISGRIGDSLLQVGGLVTRTSPQPLTTIVPLDPVWVRFQVSEAEVPLFSRTDSALPIELLLNEAAAPLSHGRIENTLNSVNTRTATLEVQASFRNPDHAVLPGQFVRVRVRTGDRPAALLVPQRAVQELQGQRSVLVVGADDTVRSQAVEIGDRIDQRWVVEQGLKAGDTVVVDGFQKIRPGVKVRARASAATAAGGR